MNEQPNDNPTAAGINSPNLDPQTLQAENRAIKNAEQAGQLAKQLQEQNKARNEQNAKIMGKYNAEKPYSSQELEAEGLGWKSNFSTKPLAILIDKVSPRFTTAIQKSKYLTSSKLPATVQEADKKTDVFRREITETIRARREWKNLIGEIAQENALFGYTSTGFTDEYCWFPRHYRQDKFFVPDGTKQDVNSAQVVVVRDDFMLHELFSKIQDPESAKTMGWNVENTVEAINDATPEKLRSGAADNARVYEDLAREVSLSASLSNGAKIIAIYSVFVTELTGKISHFMVEGNKWKEIFSRYDRFDSMADCSSFYSFQQANGTMQGSKGIGREIYAMAGVLDRSRNEVVDRLQLSGKIILQTDEKLIKRFRMSVVGSAILIGSNYQISKNTLDANTEPFFQLDNYLTSLLDQISGSTSPKQLEGERVTKAQVDLFAAREEEKRDSIIERFLTQLADMVSTMQKRMCSEDTNESDAKEMQARLLQVMTREELDYVSKQPALSTIADFTELERQQVVLICAEAKGNPLYNQKEIERRKLTATVGAEFADAVLLPDEDPTVVAEQSRQQQMENLLLTSGQQVPVSPRDNARVHLDTLKPLIAQTAKVLITDPTAQDLLLIILQHAQSHVDVAVQAGGNPKDYAEDEQILTQAKAAIQKLQQHEAEQIQPPTQNEPVIA